MPLKKLPIQHSFELGTEERELPSGNPFSLPTVSLDTSKTITLEEKDQDMFADFMAWVQNYNDYINSDWQKKTSAKMSDEQMEVVETFVDIE